MDAGRLKKIPVFADIEEGTARVERNGQYIDDVGPGAQRRDQV
jgi:hypothetical protein